MTKRMMRIDEIWSDLEKDISVTSGFIFRRFSGTVVPDVFVALKMPEKIKCISATIPNNIKIDISALANLRDIQAEVIPDPQSAKRNILSFKLSNNLHADVFAVLCEDLLLSIGNPKTTYELVDALLNRFFVWKTLFDKINTPGLTPTEQQGLFAELLLLKKMITTQPQAVTSVIESWVGPGREVRDFQMHNIAIEAKCSVGNNHQKVNITSERQLDRTHLTKLYLYHLSAERRQNGGETLPTLISSIEALISTNSIAYTKFRNKLLEACYFDTHASTYANVGYVTRNEDFYEIGGDFPRIEEHDLRKGVGDVNYTVILSQCSSYLVEETTVFRHFLSYE